MDLDKKYIEENIKKLGYKHGVGSIFEDFEKCCAYSLMLAVKKDDEIEDSYNKLISKYNEEEVATFSKMYLALSVESLKNKQQDILGELYENLGLSTDRLGQFFTPVNICNMMANMIFDKESAEKEINDNGYIMVSDPACGSGRTLLAYLNAARENGISSDNIFFHGGDISELCTCMTYVNLSLMGANAMIQNMDTLLNKVYYTYFTPNLASNRKMLDYLVRDGYLVKTEKESDAEYEQ